MRLWQLLGNVLGRTSASAHRMAEPARTDTVLKIKNNVETVMLFTEIILSDEIISIHYQQTQETVHQVCDFDH